MGYGCTTTGPGAPVGGAISNTDGLGLTPPPLSTGTSSGSSYNLGSTLDSNFGSSSSLWNQGLTDVWNGYNELGQSGALGSGFQTTSFEDFCKGSGSTGSSTGPTTDSSTGSTPGPITGDSSGVSPGSNTTTKSGDSYLTSFDDWMKSNGQGQSTGPQTGGTAGGDGFLQSYDDFWKGRDNPVQTSSFDDFMKTFDGPAGNTGTGTTEGLTSFDDWLKGFNAPVGGNAGGGNDPGNLVNLATNDPRLTPALTQIANDPVGNKLLNGALNDGLQGISVTNLPPGFYGQFQPGAREIQIAPMTLNSNDLVRTIAHELVHASTVGNGDSLNEENLADQIGTQVQRRTTGQGPGYVLGGDSYNGLPQDNGIVNALRLLGITV